MTLELAALPYDVVLMILQQPSLGLVELCRLECCSRTMRSLIDDKIWRQAFLRHRRCNALREPESWKGEYLRRESYSRQWRNLPNGLGASGLRNGQRLVGNTAQKLRRFTQKFMPGSPTSPPARMETHVVEQNSKTPGIHATISAALLASKPFDRIQIRRGVYTERLRLDKPVELVGAGAAESVVLIGVDGPAIEISSKIVSRVANMKIEQKAHTGGGAMSGTVLIKGGAVLCIEECIISSETGHCVIIQGLDTHGVVQHNMVQHGNGVGVLVCDHGRGHIEDNDISHNGRAGVAILSGADPYGYCNKIHEGMDSGVLVSERGRGRIEDNDIFANRRAGVAILKEGSPLVKHNRIHDGRDSGVLVCEHGQGSVIDNDIFANRMAGVAIGRGGASRVTGNTIRDGNGGSLCLSMHSRGLISSNIIHQDPRAVMQVPEGLLPEVQQHNMIQYSDDIQPMDIAHNPRAGTASPCVYGMQQCM